MQIIRIGNIGGGKTQSRTVYSSSGLCPTLSASMGPKGNTMPYIVAMRGRDKTNPSYRGGSNENFEQRLEVRMDNLTNTITTVQKDNLVLIKQATKSGSVPCIKGGWQTYPTQQAKQEEGE